jgi:GDP/UDP-N,N'-diacetylbacillosamine 2-epimerase (hydrolysing)
MNKRKIACVTGTRADYPRVRSVLKEINKRDNLELYIIATGSHLLEEYGYSAQEIIDDGFKISHKVEMFKGDFDTPLGMAQASARCTSGIAKALDDINPDLVLITVDRVETLASITAASLMNFPIAHIQGGEVTGTIDESIRHAVTKLSHIHFPATSDAAQRIINMGENKDFVFNTGCPYIDEINQIVPIEKKELSNRYGFDSTKKLIIFTQHSVTTEFEDSLWQVEETIEALENFSETQIICFFSNTDAGGKKIIDRIEKQKNFIKIPNMLSHDFLSLMSHSSLMIGNSSAGIREAPSFKLPVINIGTRQNGRLRARNVIDVEHNAEQIKKAITKSLYDEKFINSLNDLKNPYGDGNAAIQIVDILENIKLDLSLIQKEICYDI